MLVILAIFAFKLDPTFVSVQTQLQIAGSLWDLALVAIPMTLIILTGGIDLSVGAIMSLSAVAFGMTFEKKLPIAVCCVMCLGCGLVAGLLNGIFITKVRVHPLIVTLATMSMFFGFAEGLSNARPFSGFPVAFTEAVFSKGSVIPLAGIIVIGFAALAAFWLRRTPNGQALYAMGLNELASRNSGLAVDRIKLFIYTLSGLVSSIAAIFYLCHRNTAKADIGGGFELDVITAVVVGGTSIYGGRGSLLGTILGVLLVHETRQFVSWHWEKDELNLIVIGGLLIFSVLLNKLFIKSSKSAQ